jgi:hypothetical protein
MISVTFPGRAGDLLWALPTVRALAEIHGPVSLRIAGEFASMLPLLQQQPYLKVVVADHAWSLTPPNDWQPPVVEEGEIHLGYRGWPDQPLAQYIYGTLKYHYPHLAVAGLDLESPWITIPPLPNSWGTTCTPVGFTEAWFELKVGLLQLLQQEFAWTQNREDVGWPTTALMQMATPGGRWVLAGWRPYTWVEAAEFITASSLFVGDCSALHVLAVACGTPVIVVEPMEARWNGIFYPVGKVGRVHLVTGNDGLPTFDARHVADTIRGALNGR